MASTGAISPSSSRRGGNGLRYVAHHERYYLVGGDLFVLVSRTSIDGVMFKIHSYFFKRESRNFFDDAPPPTPSSSAPEVDDRGTCEDRAIHILDVTVQEFEQFLWVFYNPLYSVYDADITAFFSILKLAHRWDFPVVKDFAIRELRRREDEVPLVRRIRLYQEYDAPAEFLVPLYAELCAREWSPTDNEVEELGYEQMYYVMKARETLRSTGGISPLPSGMTQLETFSTIENVFGLPQYTTEHEPENNDANLPAGEI
ncbi:hypothetical protein DFP72DRAFT_818034 [Ephemerocybe angulata]|uniref:BTB domain-containing protein n=1 Tax=Ephemerocybe angulata TaxID=980116 RepID=A0A8H6HQX4_9AGAR|nr:hypothetical protein DFP72DRAFT_818034 [Tulosesus angulatus]